MAKAIHLIGWFLTGCIASTLFLWSASLHPVLQRFVITGYIVIAVTWAAFLILDDAVLGYFERISILGYRAILIATALAVLCGLGIGVAICLQSG